MMKKLNIIIAIAASTVLLSGCLKDTDPQPRLVGGTTFINTFIEAEAVYYWINRNTIQGLNPLRYRSYGPTWPAYIHPGHDRRFEIYSTYEDNRLVDTTVTILDSVYYSSVIYGTHDAPRHFITEDRIPEGEDNPETIAAVRFYNLANTDRRVTLHIGELEPIHEFRDRPTETPQSGKDGEDFTPVAVGTYHLRVTDEEGETVTIREEPVVLAAGSYISIFLTGDERDPTTFYVGRVQQWVN